MSSFAMYALLAGIAYVCLLTPVLLILYAHGEREAARRERERHSR